MALVVHELWHAGYAGCMLSCVRREHERISNGPEGKGSLRTLFRAFDKAVNDCGRKCRRMSDNEDYANSVQEFAGKIFHWLER